MQDVGVEKGACAQLAERRICPAVLDGHSKGGSQSCCVLKQLALPGVKLVVLPSTVLAAVCGCRAPAASTCQHSGFMYGLRAVACSRLAHVMGLVSLNLDSWSRQ